MIIERRAMGEPDDDLCAAAASWPNVGPFRVDRRRREIVFVETDPAADLQAAPFLYQAQETHARRWFALPYARAREVASRMPRFERLIPIFSVGRCGSTLVSKIFARVEETLSLSEPNIFMQLALLRAQGWLDDEEARMLIDLALQLSFRAGHRHLVIKMRAQCMHLADLVVALHPALFIYRDAVDCIDSHLRAFGAAPPERPFRDVFGVDLPAGCAVERIGNALLEWITFVQQYRVLRAAGARIVALRYENLAASPRSSITELFRWCGIPEERVDVACRAMDSDPHAGTPLGRNLRGLRTLTTDEEDCIRAVVQHYTGLAPDATLPGTIN